MPRHRGTVIQVATSADAGWTTWPLHPSYPPVMEQIVLQAASGRLAERNVRVGQPLDQALPASGAGGRRSTVVLPDGRSVAVEAPGRRGRQPAPLRGHRALGRLPGQGRPAAGRSSRPSPPTPTRPRATRPSSTAPGWPSRPRLDLRLPDQLERADRQRRRRSAAAASCTGPCSTRVLVFLLIVESVLAWKFGHHAPRPREDRRT